jgi:predicted amino acid racemase
VSTPRLELRLDRIGYNARALVDRLGLVGIRVCGVTKATLGSPEVARELLAAGVASLGESRVENVEHLRRAGITAEIMLVRSPMVSQIDRVVAATEVSLNSELAVIDRLSASACRQGMRHGVVLMVELGDRREGIMPADLLETVRRVLELPGVVLRGIGTNLACQNGVIPGVPNMAELSDLATSVESVFGLELDIVSGGNSANLPWALAPGVDIGRVDHLRLGESLLLGREPVRRTVIEGLHVDAVSVVGEVIESKPKPATPRGVRGQTAFGHVVGDGPDPDGGNRVIVALGRQDLDTEGIVAPDGFDVLGASSDHLVLACAGEVPAPGAELRFGVNYSALMRAAASPFVTRWYLR